MSVELELFPLDDALPLIEAPTAPSAPTTTLLPALASSPISTSTLSTPTAAGKSTTPDPDALLTATTVSTSAASQSRIPRLMDIRVPLMSTIPGFPLYRQGYHPRRLTQRPHGA
ncbi:unnamed protein product [Didymodactylos carnosus]|uniref:Uncharacterized protein n=1 Tax=Didymodactylos carnosus TaxID=1234261 RepID=A0A815YDH3_9BILA|nr:unnamed protein product [Didymodactylos carnosus]CAF4431450.1 unnamed protein product [Didymodactylos carnosus]